MLITKYLASVTASIDPFNTGSKATRLFLSLVTKESARRDSNTKIQTKVVPTGSASTLEVAYKDGKKEVFQAHTLAKLVAQVNRHSRALQIMEQASA
ncbi:hypothetical protein PYCC9005_003049 [Savitreella phatthalungensis]